MRRYSYAKFGTFLYAIRYIWSWLKRSWPLGVLFYAHALQSA